MYLGYLLVPPTDPNRMPMSMRYVINMVHYINNTQVYVDLVAKQKWVNSSQRQQTFENCRHEVIAMLEHLYRDDGLRMRRWLTEVNTMLAP